MNKFQLRISIPKWNADRRAVAIHFKFPKSVRKTDPIDPTLPVVSYPVRPANTISASQFSKIVRCSGSNPSNFSPIPKLASL